MLTRSLVKNPEQPLDMAFSIADYVIFIASILLWILCGIFYAFRNKKQTTQTMLVGDGKLPILPTALALVASFMSAVSLLGYPAEIYQFGVMFCWYAATYLIVFPVAAYGFVPVFFEVQVTSAYAYLELRFDKYVRYVASTIYVLETMLYMSVVLYAPALALSSVTGIDTYLAIIATGCVATVYTTVGGAVAVVWISAFQMAVIFAGLIAVVAGGVVHTGGSFGDILEINRQGGRLYGTDFRVDPRIRHSFWSLFVGGTFTLLTLFAANQIAIQRYIGIPKLRDAQIAMLANIPINWCLLLLYTFCGFILYAVYHACDPKLLGKIDRSDQLLPFFVVNHLSYLPGFGGIFISAVYSAGLSTISGGVNCLAAVILEDGFFPLRAKFRNGEEISETLKLRVTRGISVVVGLTLILGAILLEQIGSPTVLQIAMSVFGMVGGPLLGSFILGMFLPRVNEKGALAALLSSLFVCFWFGIGGIISGTKTQALPTDVSNCNSSVPHSWNMTLDLPVDNPVFKGPYDVSYQYYSLIGVLVSIVVGLVVSVFTGKPAQEKLKPKYFSPFIRKFIDLEDVPEITEDVNVKLVEKNDVHTVIES